MCQISSKLEGVENFTGWFHMEWPLWGFERISTVTIMYLLYSVNVYIFNVVIEIKFYSVLLYSILFYYFLLFSILFYSFYYILLYSILFYSIQILQQSQPSCYKNRKLHGTFVCVFCLSSFWGWWLGRIVIEFNFDKCLLSNAWQNITNYHQSWLTPTWGNFNRAIT